MLIEECKKDTPKQKLRGIAVVTRKGSFMAGSEIFIKNGYAVIDTANPDFKLLVEKFSSNAWKPKFKITGEIGFDKYITGLTIIRADQCSYTAKNTKEICETAKKDYGLKIKFSRLFKYLVYPQFSIKCALLEFVGTASE